MWVLVLAEDEGDSGVEVQPEIPESDGIEHTDISTAEYGTLELPFTLWVGLIILKR